MSGSPVLARWRALRRPYQRATIRTGAGLALGAAALLGLLLAVFLVFPFVGLAAAAFFVDSGIFATILDVLPFSQAAKLLGDGLSPQAPFDAGPVAWLVIAAWGRRLRRPRADRGARDLIDTPPPHPQEY